MKKLSIGSWAYLFNQEQPTNDFHALVHKLMHLGYQGVELGGFAPHPDPDNHSTKEERQKLHKMVVDHRLQFSAYAPALWPQPIWKDDDHAPFLAAFEKHAIFAEDLGIPRIRIDTVGPIQAVKDSGIEAKRIFDRFVKTFDACSKLAAQHGLTVCWEFEPCFPVNKPSEIIALVDAVRNLGNANFGVLFDTCNAHLCAAIGANQIGETETLPGGALEFLQKLQGKIVHLHFSDSDGTLNEYGGGAHVPLGKGVLNFDQLVPELLKCGVPNDWWCVDLAFCPDAWPATAECKRFLDKMRHKYAA
jgi:sugar phosphate isomerase/epimerase